jgi:hypothetical protein
MRAALIAGLLSLSLTGCTVWGAKNPPTVKSMTGAEDHERVFWSQARAGRWNAITPLLAANVVYAVGGRILSRDQIVPYLQSEKIRDFVVSDTQVMPNGPDMTVSYHLQISSANSAARSLTAVSVWQQVKSGWILIVHTEQPQ